MAQTLVRDIADVIRIDTLRSAPVLLGGSTSANVTLSGAFCLLIAFMACAAVLGRFVTHDVLQTTRAWDL